MQLIYNSPHYYVLEFPESSSGQAGGYEIVDKGLRREIYLQGVDAEVFRRSVQELVAKDPSAEDVDDFLDGYRELMHQSVALH